MGTKMAVSFANIVTAEIETDIINQSPKKTLIWKRYIDQGLGRFNRQMSLWPLSLESYGPCINVWAIRVNKWASKNFNKGLLLVFYSLYLYRDMVLGMKNRCHV